MNFGRNHISYWGCAIAGEVGELCNRIKKHERDGVFDKSAIGYELADIFIYTELIARQYGIDLEEAILQKIEIINKRQRKKLRKVAK